MEYIGNRDILREYKKSVHTITDDILFMKASYLQARKDEVRQEIIDGINNGKIKSEDDIDAITIKQAKGYQWLVDNDELPDFMEERI